MKILGILGSSRAGGNPIICSGMLIYTTGLKREFRLPIYAQDQGANKKTLFGLSYNFS